MNELIKLFERMQSVKQSMVLDISFDRVADWYIEFVWRDKEIILFSQDTNITIASIKMIKKLIDLCSDYEELQDIPGNVL